jgi:type I restriction enzyme R subunit
LKKSELTAAEIKRIKYVAVELLKALKAEKLRVDHWRDKEATRDAVRLTIKDSSGATKRGCQSTSTTNLK